MRIARAAYDPARVAQALRHAELLHAAWPLVPIVYDDLQSSSQRRRLSTILIRMLVTDRVKYKALLDRAVARRGGKLYAHELDAIQIFDHIVSRTPRATLEALKLHAPLS